METDVKKLLIHVGTHKTGTSFLQKKLLTHIWDIKKVDAIKYINFFRFPEAQKLMTQEVVNPQLQAALIAFFNAEIEAGITKYVVSCEYFSGNPKLFYKNAGVLAEMLDAATQTFQERQLLFGVRRQDQFIQSIYNQYLKQGEEITLESLLNTNDWEGLKWVKFVKKYTAFFGQASAHIFPYDPAYLKAQDILSVFNTHLGSKVLGDLKGDGTVNKGFSPEGVKALELLNGKLNSSERTFLKGVLHTHFSKPLFEDYNLLSQYKVEEILGYYAEDNEDLFSGMMQVELEGFSKPVYDSKGDFQEFLTELTTVLIEANSKAEKRLNYLENHQQSSLLKRTLRRLKDKFKAS